MKLVLAEKPSVAQSIAKVLGAAKRCDGYLEGGGYLVSWCVGHLVELLLGLGKTESYRLVKQQYFKTITVGHRMRVMVDSFEEWYANQCWYRKADGTPPGENIKKTTFSAAELGTLLGVSEATA